MRSPDFEEEALIGRTLAHYRITAKLGAGGMGEVYRATDTKLGRDVALKVLPAEMAASPDRLERFRREAKALAALDHPGIVAVYDIDEAAGVHFLTMQLVEGQPLDWLIPKSGLPLDRLTEIGAALTDALAAAHEKGIVHRDLKPANVVVAEDGGMKVLDFGLAKIGPLAESVGSELPTEAQTRDGVVMRTVPYMSSEQVSGRPVDHRTDVFSLGVVLYEMASGRRPFQGQSTAELASAILRDTPPAIKELRPDLPSDLVRIIRRCLEKEKGQRFQTARDVGNELRDMRRHSTPTSGSVAPETSVVARLEEGFWVAVLPFKHRGSDPGVEALAEGMTEEIVAGLSRFSYLRVIARGSTAQYASGTVDVREVGRQIGARAFDGGSAAAVISEVLRDEPRPMVDLQPLTSPGLESACASSRTRIEVGKPETIHQFDDAHAGGRFPEISPDGQFVIYVSDEAGAGDEVFMTRFPSGSEELASEVVGTPITWSGESSQPSIHGLREVAASADLNAIVKRRVGRNVRRGRRVPGPVDPIGGGGPPGRRRCRRPAPRHNSRRAHHRIAGQSPAGHSGSEPGCPDQTSS